MNRRRLLAAPLALGLLALGRAAAQDGGTAPALEPGAVLVRHDLSPLAEAQGESPAPDLQAPIPGEDSDSGTANGVAFPARPAAGDLNQQLQGVVTALVRPGTWGETPELEVKGEFGTRGEPATLPGGFAPDPGEPALLVKRAPAVQKEVKALLDGWARFLARRYRLEVELRHYAPEALPSSLRGTPLPTGDALAQVRAAGERILSVTKSVPANARRHVFERRSRAGKPFAESQNDLDLIEPLLVEAQVSPLPSGRLQLALHVASGQWIDAERVIVGRRFGVAADLEPGHAAALARLDDERGTDLLIARVTAPAPAADAEPFAFFDASPLLDENDSAAAVSSGSSDGTESPRLARTLLARANEKLPEGAQAVRCGSVFVAPRASREKLLATLSEAERPARTVDVVLGSIDPDKVPEDGCDSARFRALAGELQVLERFSGRVLEGARVLARRAAQAWNAAGERQESLVARSWADLALLRDGDLRILTLRTQTAVGNAHAPVCEVPIVASARLERDRYVVVQASSREGRSTILLVGEPATAR